MSRRTISTRERVAIFQAANGLCHICQSRIVIGDAWELEHIIPLALGGDDHGENLAPAHVKCHRAKSVDDAGNTARAKRREARHLGAKTSRTPMPGGRNSPWKRKLNGTTVKRGEG
jgi:5-methylcytosine-specific restriction enzyme A